MGGCQPAPVHLRSVSAVGCRRRGAVVAGGHLAGGCGGSAIVRTCRPAAGAGHCPVPATHPPLGRVCSRPPGKGDLVEGTRGRKSAGRFQPDGFVAPAQGQSRRHEERGGGCNACVEYVRSSSSPWPCCHHSCVGPCGQCRPGSLPGLLRGLPGRRSEGRSETIPNKFFFCSYFQFVEESTVNPAVPRRRCPPAVGAQLLVSLGPFRLRNRLGLQQLCMSLFFVLSPNPRGEDDEVPCQWIPPPLATYHWSASDHAHFEKNPQRRRTAIHGLGPVEYKAPSEGPCPRSSVCRSVSYYWRYLEPGNLKDLGGNTAIPLTLLSVFTRALSNTSCLVIVVVAVASSLL